MRSWRPLFAPDGISQPWKRAGNARRRPRRPEAPPGRRRLAAPGGRVAPRADRMGLPHAPVDAAAHRHGNLESLSCPLLRPAGLAALAPIGVEPPAAGAASERT